MVVCHVYEVSLKNIGIEMRLKQEFYARSARVVAQALLGKRLVRLWHGQRLSGTIVETEAYCDADEPDLACHAERANKGKPTSRTAVMFGPAGVSYVYFTYGIHWMFNVVTGETDEPNAVLIRAIEPVEGIETMVSHRNKRPISEVTNGPAKLAQALAIDKSLNGANLCVPDGVIWIENAAPVASDVVETGPRIGMGKTPEPWYSMPWRYWIRGNAFVSKQ
jgi:DNA-3-methyladenine glycosylase